MSQPNSSDAQLGLFASVKPHYILVQYESTVMHPYYGTPCRWQNMLDAKDEAEVRGDAAEQGWTVTVTPE
jgi:hypothetical protein